MSGIYCVRSSPALAEVKLLATALSLPEDDVLVTWSRVRHVVLCVCVCMSVT